MAQTLLEQSSNALVPTVIQPSHIAVKDATWTAGDIYFILAICVAVCVIAGFFLNRAAQKRKEDRDDAQERTQRIMDSIAKSHNDSARDVRELSDKVRDGKTVMEKDIESIRSVTRHDLAGIKTQFTSVQHFIDKNAEETTKLRDRMIAQETHSKHQNEALNKLDATVRETFAEVKALIKQQGETSTAQFKELAVSIREGREVRQKP